jgi:hypothetical protein
MADFLALKLLTEKSDLGWFKSIYEGRGLKGRQKSITLNVKGFSGIYPELEKRVSEYDAAREEERAALQLNPPDNAAADASG